MIHFLVSVDSDGSPALVMSVSYAQLRLTGMYLADKCGMSMKEYFQAVPETQPSDEKIMLAEKDGRRLWYLPSDYTA